MATQLQEYRITAEEIADMPEAMVYPSAGGSQIARPAWSWWRQIADRRGFVWHSAAPAPGKDASYVLARPIAGLGQD